MLQRAEERLNSNIAKADNWKDFMDNLNKLKIVKTWWCDTVQCESEVKAKSKSESVSSLEGEQNLSGGAKTLCKPFEQEQ